jgi:hypothetical protein
VLFKLYLDNKVNIKTLLILLRACIYNLKKIHAHRNITIGANLKHKPINSQEMHLWMHMGDFIFNKNSYV